MRTSLVLAVAATVLLVTPFAPPLPAHAADALDGSDFLTADGSVLRTGSGSGDVINLRGTNVGGWLAQEDWMSPLGEFAIDRHGWSATASSGEAAAVLDGSQATRWTTGELQSGTEWLHLDLGAPTQFNRLSLDDSGASGDFPRALVIEVSSDGSTWESVAAQPGTSGVTTVKFAMQVSRFVRLAQTSTAEYFWSVGELNLFLDPVLTNPPQRVEAFTSGPGVAPSAAMDGALSTVWQSGVPQAPGQTVTVDFGRSVQMDRVLVDSGAAHPDDYPREWELQTSDDNAIFTPVASGYGTNRIVEADFKAWKYARYLRIVSHGAASEWWSIAEVSISTGNILDRSTWKITASEGSAPTNALDGDVTSRWTTGVAQNPGQEIEADLGALVTLNNVSIDTARDATDEGDWARGYRLDVSRDGVLWSTVAVGVGSVKATNIGFTAQALRFFRLTQTGTALQWWSVGELTAGLYSDDYSLNDTLTARFGVKGAQSVIDAHQDTWITETDIDNIAATGLNFIRVPIGWNTFLNLDGTWKPNPWEKLDWLIEESSQRGIYVLLDLHMVPGGGCSWGSCGRIGPSPNGFWGNPTYQDWVQDIWENIAARYEGNPAVAGYDLINEPLIDPAEDTDDLKKKNDFFDRIYDAVRAIDPDHLIVLPAFLGMDSIADPDDYGWTNVMYQLHPYDMSAPKDWNAQNQLVTNELAATPQRLTDPGVPILNGEYSLYYNDDVWARFMAGMNAQHVSWSNWTYKVRGQAEDAFGYWGMYYDNQNPVPIINSDDQATFTRKLTQFTTTNFTRNDRFVETVKKYAGGLSTYNPITIDPTGWTATASTTAPDTTPTSGIDGINNTAWTSGHPQTGGEWYQIDMGTTHTVAMITLETAPWATTDYPRSFTIDTSTDGTTWTTTTTGTGYGYKRPITIPPTTTRYIRITQTSTTTHWWNINNITLHTSY
ncbi:discoidin domain-containing protein [Microbacterium sp. P02]|uniref:discoidin domain-containing protein n=1 Tax=Microbacterium sp. P02 TaxID=3366260 RepID=UPI00367050B6